MKASSEVNCCFGFIARNSSQCEKTIFVSRTKNLCKLEIISSQNNKLHTLTARNTHACITFHCLSPNNYWHLNKTMSAYSRQLQFHATAFRFSALSLLLCAFSFVLPPLNNSVAGKIFPKQLLP